MEMVREVQREAEREIERENNWVEYYGDENVKVVGKSLEEELIEKYKDSPLKLRVYIDREEEKYYIDTFAAYSLGFISYVRACNDSDFGKNLFEISPATLAMLERVFEGKIEYQYLPPKRKARVAVDQYDANEKEVDKGNMISDLINNSKNKYDNKELNELFEKQLNDLSEFGSDMGKGNRR